MKRTVLVMGALLAVLVWLTLHPYGVPSICYGVTLHAVPYPYHPIPCGYQFIER